MTKHAVIVGNGLAGSLLAVLLAREGWRVSVYERRGDPRAMGYQGGRSINLALSVRGLTALAAAGLEEAVRERDIIPMPGRMIHAVDSKTVFQPYSMDPREAINSVSRGGLNLTLIEAAAACPGVEFFFDHPCVDVDLADGVAIFQKPDGSRVSAAGDLVVGADGAFSAVRGVMQKSDRFEYSQTYLGHGYKELHIPPFGGPVLRAGSWLDAPEPPTRKTQFGELGHQMQSHALHIWPRGGSMMIALPNRDGSFTCTLFWPWEGEGSFASLRTPEDVRRHFASQYADAMPLMPTLEHDYFANPASSLVTVRCRPWRSHGRVVLVGDAAHAIVPFYGQGMNAAFEDCTALVRYLRERSDQADALAAFEAERKPNADAIAGMALDNFVEMRDKVGHPEFLYRKKIEHTLHAADPERFWPQYNLVSFSNVPYVEARQRGDTLVRVIDAVVKAIPMGQCEAMGDGAWAARVLDFGLARGARVHEAELIDISPTISESLNVWPGDNGFSREVLADTEKGANITLSTIRTTVHLGSHADASNHYGTKAEGAVGIDAMPLRHYVGPCRVVSVLASVSRGVSGRRIVPADIVDFDAITEPRVLLKTCSFPDPHQWNSDFDALSVELVEALAARGVITIGIDTPSVDVQDSKDLPAHRAILRHKIAIIEGLRLAAVEPGVYELMAAPLKLAGADASPVRAVLRK